MPKAKRHSKRYLGQFETANTRACYGCETIKPLTEFYKNRDGRKGFKSRCKACVSIRRGTYQREYDASHKCEARDRWLKRYGITQADYDRMLKTQGGRCAICRSTDTRSKNSDRFDVDHDHKSGKVRGLLCRGCNTGLGKFKDNPHFMWTAIEYLAQSNAV